MAKPLVVLANEMGTGKTVIASGSVLANIRRLEPSFTRPYRSWAAENLGQEMELANAHLPEEDRPTSIDQWLDTRPIDTWPCPPSDYCEANDFPIFLPTLYIVPLNIIPATHTAIQGFFPDATIHLYYGARSAPIIENASVVRTGGLHSLMNSL